MESNYKSIIIQHYDYNLDESRIAKHPLQNRDESKLLVYNNNEIIDSSFTSITNLLFSGDLLIFNNTRVIQARLEFIKTTGAKIEIFLLSPISPSDYQLSFSETSKNRWNCLVGNFKRWKGEDLEMRIPLLGTILKATFVERSQDGAIVEFTWDKNMVSFGQIVEHIGKVPIPPYLNRQPVDEDKDRYQTVYAKPEGSVAAPTAGLHFTETIINSIASKGVNICDVTLHVGAGTFQPVKSETIGEHHMHSEKFYVTVQTIEMLLKTKGRIIAVGTTSMRTLESLYWLGVKIIEKKIDNNIPEICQWDGYLQSSYSLTESLRAIKQYIENTNADYLMASTQMIIVPGYKFRVVQMLITNFHQPRSTLLLLVSAFIGEDWKRVYQYALDNGFRFLSYGDSSILFRT